MDGVIELSRAGQPRWSCIGGITDEGARAPGASNHVRFPSEPKIPIGRSPITARRLATERADRAHDATGAGRDPTPTHIPLSTTESSYCSLKWRSLPPIYSYWLLSSVAHW